MARKSNHTAIRNAARSTASVFEALESRTMYSATPALMGYLQDYKMAAGQGTNAEYTQTNWGDGTTTTDNLDWSHLTQLNYFSLVPNADGHLPTYVSASGATHVVSASQDDADAQVSGLMNEVNLMNPNVKVFVSVGGETAVDAMTAMINGGQTAYNNFTADIKSFIDNHGLAGVDLDWEPASATIQQIQGFSTLITTLHNAGIDVTAAVMGDATPIVDANGNAVMIGSKQEQKYELDQSAVETVSAVEVMAYPATDISDANQDLTNWTDYLSGTGDATVGDNTDAETNTLNTATTPISKLQYGLDCSTDDSSNTADVVSQKVTQTLDNGYSAMFLWDLQSPNSNTILSEIEQDVANAAPSNPTPAPATTGTISGTVTSTTGAPIAGETIYLDPQNAGQFETGDATATTDANGNYTFSNVPVGATIVRQILPSGDTQVSPSNGYGQHVTVAAGGSLTGENFSDTVPAPAPVSGPVQLTGAVIGTSGSWDNLGNTIANVFDGNTATFFDAPTGGDATTPDWVGLDLGAAASITEIKYVARSGYEWRMEGGVFQGANNADFSDAVDLATIGNTTAPSSSSWNVVSVSGTYRYVRYVAPAGGYGNIAEMQVWGTAAPVASPQGVITPATAPFSDAVTIGISDEAGVDLA